MTRHLLCALAVWCGAVSLAAAQSMAPTLPIPHSGIITDAAAQRAGASRTVIFALYETPTGSAAIWSEIQTVQTDANGRYAVRLGSATALPARLDTRRPLWLGVQPTGQPEQRRTRLTPAATEKPTDLDQEWRPDDALRVFLDCARCDITYLRQEITYLNYVVDRQDAQVHVLVTTQPTGGGTEYSFAFIGLETFAGRDDQVLFMSSVTDTEDERREGIAQTLQLGLLRYLAGTSLASQLEISHNPNVEPSVAQPDDDPWNFWIFRASADGSVSGQSSEKERSLSGALSASRTTEQWRIRLRTNSSQDRSDFDLGDGTTFVSTFEDFESTALVVKSVGDHWGVGVVGSAISSFLNLDLTFRAAPAVEFDVFPYSDWSRRRLTLTYAVGLNAFDYDEPTILDKQQETLLDQMFRLSFATTQPWGESSVAIEASSFLDDFSKNRTTASANLDFRIVRGLSLSVWGNVSRIRDQIFLSGADLSVEDRLVRRRQLATDFFYGTGIGVSFRFGSIYNNVVNQRFSGGSRGFIKRF